MKYIRVYQNDFLERAQTVFYRVKPTYHVIFLFKWQWEGEPHHPKTTLSSLPEVQDDYIYISQVFLTRSAAHFSGKQAVLFENWVIKAPWSFFLEFPFHIGPCELRGGSLICCPGKNSSEVFCFSFLFKGIILENLWCTLEIFWADYF